MIKSSKSSSICKYSNGLNIIAADAPMACLLLPSVKHNSILYSSLNFPSKYPLNHSIENSSSIYSIQLFILSGSKSRTYDTRGIISSCSIYCIFIIFFFYLDLVFFFVV
eukprot:437325_1